MTRMTVIINGVLVRQDSWELTVNQVCFRPYSSVLKKVFSNFLFDFFPFHLLAHFSAHCVADEVQSFEQVSHGRDVSVMITYNKEFQDQVKNKDKTDDLPKIICDAITAQKGVDEDSEIHIWLMQVWGNSSPISGDLL